MKKIILTGGGTAGHVTPNIALLPTLRKEGFDTYYIGAINGIEKNLVEKENIPYYGISSGKFRRYFSLKNFTDPFRVLKGIFESIHLLKKIKPNIVFSKGGFVSVPVVIAASFLKIPVVIHESDLTPGLANKISIPKAKKVCCNFPETLPYLPSGKALVTGCPIRQELFLGDRKKALDFTNLKDDLPFILVIGGSLGSVAINKAVRESLPELKKNFNIIHLCGKGNIDESLSSTSRYVQYEYVSNELKDLFALSDLIVSRAGANAICEIAALKKPNLLIPLSASASRGDQILNAKSFKKQGLSQVIFEEDLSSESLLSNIDSLWNERETYVNNLKNSPQGDAINIITKLLKNLC